MRELLQMWSRWKSAGSMFDSDLVILKEYSVSLGLN